MKYWKLWEVLSVEKLNYVGKFECCVTSLRWGWRTFASVDKFQMCIVAQSFFSVSDTYGDCYSIDHFTHENLSVISGNLTRVPWILSEDSLRDMWTFPSTVFPDKDSAISKLSLPFQATSLRSKDLRFLICIWELHVRSLWWNNWEQLNSWGVKGQRRRQECMHYASELLSYWWNGNSAASINNDSIPPRDVCEHHKKSSSHLNPFKILKSWQIVLSTATVNGISRLRSRSKTFERKVASGNFSPSAGSIYSN